MIENGYYNATWTAGAWDKEVLVKRSIRISRRTDYPASGKVSGPEEFNFVD